MNPPEPQQKPPLLYWEDFPVGSVREFGHAVMERKAMIAFAREFDPQPFHLDEAAARDSIFGGLSASGWHTCSVLMRMMVDNYLSGAASMGSPGIEQLKWLKPVLVGDVLRARATVLATRPLQSRPGIGLVTTQWEVFNQRNEVVMTMQGLGMFGRRPA